MQVSVDSLALEKAAYELLALPFFEFDPQHWRLPARLTSLDRALGGRLATVLATARKTGQNRFETLCRITGPSPVTALHQGR